MRELAQAKLLLAEAEAEKAAAQVCVMHACNSNMMLSLDLMACDGLLVHTSTYTCALKG